MPRRPANTSTIPAVQQQVPLSDGDSNDNNDLSQDQADQPGPAVLISPVKACAAKREIVNKSNIEV